MKYGLEVNDGGPTIHTLLHLFAAAVANVDGKPINVFDAPIVVQYNVCLSLIQLSWQQANSNKSDILHLEVLEAPFLPCIKKGPCLHLYVVCKLAGSCTF